MPNLNKVMVMGHLARDLEEKNTTSGLKIANGCIGVNSFAGKGKEPETVWLDFVIFGARAEAAIKYLSKGSAVYLEGKLKQESWVGKDNVKKTKIGMIVDDFQFVGGKSDKPREAAPAKPAPAPAADDDDDSIPF